MFKIVRVSVPCAVSAPSCTHPCATLHQVMGGVAVYMGGQATWAAVNDLFPSRDTATDLKRKMGISLSDDQVHAVRVSLSMCVAAGAISVRANP